uniref:zinc finger protein 470-like n=1 Tax=Osmia lignaria TaxID=473952 RepID=UPI0014785AC5|nr:zinc finger protein 470-like [Osmia lignaria]
MASLDMQQQTVLSEIVENERAQEEIELTELLPVKQCEISEENVIFAQANFSVNAEVDASTSDALKVLASFGIADECKKEQFSRRILQRAGKQARGHGRGEKQRKQIDEYVGKSSDDNEIDLTASHMKLVNQTFEDDGAKRKRKRVGRKEEESINVYLSHGKRNFLMEYNEEEPTYLDLDKNNHANDEIYVFRREPLDSEQRRNRNRNSIKANEVYENNYHPSTTTDGALFDRMAISCRKRNVEKRIEEKVGNRSNPIVEENYLDEGENNNMVRSNRLKIENEMNEINEEEKDGDDDEVDTDISKEESRQKKYCCVVCEARFKGSGGLRNHYKIVHGAGPVFKCDECGKEFPLKERLKLHVRTHTGFKPYKCCECDKSFARGGQLVQHRRTHSQVKPYRCGLCSGTFTCAANLALHVKRHNGQKDHKCEICGRAFVRRDALKKHLECLHRDVKSFLCVICNKTFKGHLPQHMRTHARDRPHGCATCGQRFAQKSQLTVHQRTHSGQRPFRCLVCWQAFAHSTALKLHTRRHTGERPFKCAECNAGFTQLPHWKKHMKCIHGRNEPYACNKCKSFFRIKNDLECHEKTCHPEFAIISHDLHDHPDHPDHSNPRGSSTNPSVAAAAAAAAADAFTPPPPPPPLPPPFSNELVDKHSSPPSKYRLMTVERMRLLLAVLLKRISKQERLDELGFGKRLIDQVLHDSLISAGKDPVASHGLSELETLTKNLEIFLKWTVPKEHWEHFRRLNKTPEDILETLTAT